MNEKMNEEPEWHTIPGGYAIKENGKTIVKPFTQRKLWDTIVDKKAKMLEQNLTPQYLIMWEGYREFLEKGTTEYRAYPAYEINGGHIRRYTFMGLEICWTQRPEVIEVY